MLNENEVIQLVQKLRAVDHELQIQLDPDKDPLDEDAFMRQYNLEQGFCVAGDKYSRDQLEIIAVHFKIDPEFIRGMDLLDFCLLFEGWLDGVSSKDYKTFEMSGDLTFEEMVRLEELNLLEERRTKRAVELFAKYGPEEAFRILRQENEEARRSAQKKKTEGGNSGTLLPGSR